MNAEHQELCLNCNNPINHKFCSHCGQPTATERMRFGRLFTSEFVQNVFNIESGFLRTCMHIVWRPGHMINDYLQGQRKSYFHFASFLIILLAIEVVLWSNGVNTPAEMMFYQITNSNVDGASKGVTLEGIETALKQQKLLFLFGIPIAALVPWLLLRKMRLSLAEHSVAIAFLLSMNTLLGFILGIIGLLPLSFETYRTVYLPISFAVLFLDFRLYWQFTRPAEYSLIGRALRVILTTAWIQFFIGVMLNLVMRINSLGS